MTTPPTTTTVSAPGKVLLAGGYLVLESPNVGLVIAANKRFYCTVEKWHAESSDSCQFQVKSPQFHAMWEYQASLYDGGVSLTASPDNSSENGFVEKTLRVTLAYILQSGKKLPSKVNLTIQADNDFYSVVPHLQERNLPRTPESVESLPKFLPCPQDADGKTIVNKTGLGSSAALVTSVVGAFLRSFSLPLDKVHNLAQICHCHAQGKVGSGFDVSSAVHGSHVYRRFPKCTLADLLQDLQNASNNISKSRMELLERAVESTWSGGVVEKVTPPEGLHLLLADVCGGSESPSMARKVLTWKAGRQDTAKEPFWEELADINPKIIQLFQQPVGDSSPLEKELPEGLKDLRSAFQQARKSLKSMGEAAGVPIEPDAQTCLADATQEIPGVVAAVVPGAGGYDALACVHLSGSKDAIGKLWAEWNKDGAQVCPLAVEADGEGIRVEEGFSVV